MTKRGATRKGEAPIDGKSQLSELDRFRGELAALRMHAHRLRVDGLVDILHATELALSDLAMANARDLADERKLERRRGISPAADMRARGTKKMTLLRQCAEEITLLHFGRPRRTGPARKRASQVYPEIVRLIEELRARMLAYRQGVAANRFGVLRDLRPNELAALTWADVDFDAGVIRAPKYASSARRRLIPIDGKSAPLIEGLRGVLSETEIAERVVRSIVNLVPAPEINPSLAASIDMATLVQVDSARFARAAFRALGCDVNVTGAERTAKARSSDQANKRNRHRLRAR